jgi:hypothetical protein
MAAGVIGGRFGCLCSNERAHKAAQRGGELGGYGAVSR